MLFRIKEIFCVIFFGGKCLIYRYLYLKILAFYPPLIMQYKL